MSGSGRGFAIISRGHNAIGAFDPQTRSYFDALGTTVIHLDGSPGAPADPSGLLTSLLDDMRADALLLRPDRVVAASGDRADLRRWHRLLTSAGITGSRAGTVGPQAHAWT
jgi:3-(3-hydroxy-phenyl)propionate hydroxylase